MTKSILQRGSLIFLMALSAALSTPIAAMDEAGEQEGVSILTPLLLVTAVPAAGFSYLWLKHYNQLHEIETLVDKSTSHVKAENGRCFLFATWRSTPDNTPQDGLLWDSPYWIAQNKGVVKDTLRFDAQQAADRVFIYDVLEARISPINVTQMQIKQAIADEKIRLEQWMQLVAGFTDMPELIAEREGEDPRCISAHEKALNCIKSLEDANDMQQVAFVNELMEQVDAAPSYKQLFHVPSIWPSEWSFAPCYTKASRLYLKLFILYVRLCAIDAAFND